VRCRRFLVAYIRQTPGEIMRRTKRRHCAARMTTCSTSLFEFTGEDFGKGDSAPLRKRLPFFVDESVE
jgi:hypothetical protein